jgi:hypothetical protein
MKNVPIWVVMFNTFSKNGEVQLSYNSFTTKKAAENEAKILRANEHKNVKIVKTILAF